MSLTHLHAISISKYLRDPGGNDDQYQDEDGPESSDEEQDPNDYEEPPHDHDPAAHPPADTADRQTIVPFG